MKMGPWDDETHRAIAQSFFAIRGIDPKILTDLGAAARNAAATWTKVQRALLPFSQNLIANSHTWKATLAALDGVFADLAEQNYKAKLIEGTGWLPHRTTPWSIIGDEENDPSELSARISKFYCDYWVTVEADLSTGVTSYNLDQEAKDTFAEALIAHRNGLFRVAPRLLFPELERIGADEINNGKHVVKKNEKDVSKVGIASLKDVRDLFDYMPMEAIFSIDQSWALFNKMQDHLYKNVRSDIEVQQAEVDPVPNRHATVHGIVAYRTQQTSLNAIIMTDFMFHLMDRLKFHVKNESESITA